MLLSLLTWKHFIKVWHNVQIIPKLKQHLCLFDKASHIPFEDGGLISKGSWLDYSLPEMTIYCSGANRLYLFKFQTWHLCLISLAKRWTCYLQPLLVKVRITYVFIFICSTNTVTLHGSFWCFHAWIANIKWPVLWERKWILFLLLAIFVRICLPNVLPRTQLSFVS